MLGREQRALVAADRRLRRERVHRLRARVRGIDSIANATTPRAASRSTPSRSASGSRIADQELALVQPRGLGLVRLAHLDDDVRLPRRAERRAGVARTPRRGTRRRSPAPGSTTTSKPAAASFPTVSGTRATRRSPGAVSRATPTLIAGTIFDAEYALRAVEHFFTHHGLPLLFVVVMLESFGIPLPGETALIFFGVLASQGHYYIVVGDRRRGGRRDHRRQPRLLADRPARRPRALRALRAG